MLPIPRPYWQNQVRKNAQRNAAGLTFMSPDHHRVRNFVVLEIPRLGRPLPPAFIADRLNLPLVRVNAILDDLEKHLTFVFRNPQGEVVWAYPVTADKTPHRVTFSTGERVYAA
jgi:hypothetical protein